MVTESQEENADNKLPPYALIIAEVLDRQRGDILVRLTDPDGSPRNVWIDDSSTAPLQEEEAARVAADWRIALPG